MLNGHKTWMRILWGLATIASGALHPVLLLLLLILGIFIFSSYLEAAVIFLIWLMAYGIVDRSWLALMLLGTVLVIIGIEWLKTRLIVY